MAEVTTERTPAVRSTRSLPAWAVVLAFILLLGFLAIIGLGLKRTQQGPIAVGQPVPPLTLTTFDGQQIHTADLKGKIILINFWASWCDPCKTEAPILESVWQEYKDSGEVVFLGVDYVDTEPEARAFMAAYNITYINGPDLGTRIAQTFRIRGVPENYILGPNGKLGYALIGGFESVDQVKSAIEQVRSDPRMQ